MLLPPPPLSDLAEPAAGEPDLDLDEDLERDPDLPDAAAGDPDLDLDRDLDRFDSSSESRRAALAFSSRLAFLVSTSLSSFSDE